MKKKLAVFICGIYLMIILLRYAKSFSKNPQFNILINNTYKHRPGENTVIWQHGIEFLRQSCLRYKRRQNFK